MLRPSLSVLSLGLVAFALGACASSGDAFFRGAPQTLALDREPLAAPSEEAQAAAEARQRAALNASSLLNGGSNALLPVRDGRGETSRSEFVLSRDPQGRVRRFAETTITLDASGVRTGRTNAVHWFGDDGQTVAFSHLHQVTLPEACRRDVAPWYVDAWFEGARLLSVERRLPPANGTGETDCAPPRPSGMTALVHPNAASVLDAFGVSDLDALNWSGAVAPPAPPRR